MKVETKVGLLFLVSLGLIIFFALLLGNLNPFAQARSIYLTFNYAGGIQDGSPVRVMGIKVGKVQTIEFDPNQKDSEGHEVKLRMKVSIDNRAWDTVRADSKFFINIAGVIGEKFIEISPGSMAAPPVVPGQSYRGEDPPRVDQLLSQGYGLAGKILEIVQKNEGSVTDTLDKMNSLVTNLNKTLTLLEKMNKNNDVARLVSNLAEITDDIKVVSKRLKTEDTAKTLDLIHRLIWRLDAVDAPAIRKFLQEEGIRAHIF